MPKHPLHEIYPNLLTASANAMQRAVAACWPEREAKAASLMFDDYLTEHLADNPASRSLGNSELQQLKERVGVDIGATDVGITFHFKIDGITYTPVLSRADATETARAMGSMGSYDA